MENASDDIESIMAKQLSLSHVERREEEILCLKDLRDKTRKMNDKIRSDRAPAQEIRQRMDGCDAVIRGTQRSSSLKRF